MLNFPRKTPSWWHKGNILPGWHRQDSPLRWSRGKRFSRWNYRQDITVRLMSVCLSCLFSFFLSFLFTPFTASTDMVKRWWSLLMGRERSILHSTSGGCTRTEPLKLSIRMGGKRQSSHLGEFELRTMNASLWTKSETFSFYFCIYFFIYMNHLNSLTWTYKL